MFDITTQRAAETAAIHLKGLDGEHLYADEAREKPVRIVIYGPGSKRFAAVEAKQTNRAIKRMQDNDGKVTAAPPEQRAAEQAEDLAAITAAFENFDYPAPKGESWASDTERFEAFYRDATLGHLTRQITKACTDWGNFKPA
jgi:hypothetical protein